MTTREEDLGVLEAMMVAMETARFVEHDMGEAFQPYPANRPLLAAWCRRCGLQVCLEADHETFRCEPTMVFSRCPER